MLPSRHTHPALAFLNGVFCSGQGFQTDRLQLVQSLYSFETKPDLRSDSLTLACKGLSASFECAQGWSLLICLRLARWSVAYSLIWFLSDIYTEDFYFYSFGLWYSPNMKCKSHACLYPRGLWCLFSCIWSCRLCVCRLWEFFGFFFQCKQLWMVFADDELANLEFPAIGSAWKCDYACWGGFQIQAECGLDCHGWQHLQMLSSVFTDLQHFSAAWLLFWAIVQSPFW